MNARVSKLTFIVEEAIGNAIWQLGSCETQATYYSEQKHITDQSINELFGLLSEGIRIFNAIKETNKSRNNYFNLDFYTAIENFLNNEIAFSSLSSYLNNPITMFAANYRDLAQQAITSDKLTLIKNSFCFFNINREDQPNRLQLLPNETLAAILNMSVSIIRENEAEKITQAFFPSGHC